MLDGYVTAFFLFDIGDAISLQRVGDTINDSVPARLSTRQSTPTYLQYQQPPLIVDGAVVDAADIRGFRARFKVFDYGVISVALTRPLPDTWEQTLAAGLEWQEDAQLPVEAERLCRAFLDRVDGAVIRRRLTFLTEDYWVFAVTSGQDGVSAEDALTTHGTEIAQLLRGERELLSLQEREETLRHRLSYYSSDTVVATWSSALVIDTPVGAPGVLEMLEYANSQLLEFRYYDQRLDAELASVYTGLQAGGWRDTLLSRRHARAARKVHALFIDVNELTDKVENALKIAGDVYAARLFALAATRLGLDQWKANVRDKLKTVDDIYRFAVEHSAMARGEFLEATIVLLIVLEIVLALI
ncbi:MAG: hypothetical protein ABL986_22505 [Vicinamibacterales bacterium]